MSMEIRLLEAQLNDFDPAIRDRALTDLLALAQEGDISLPDPAEVANMHCHTFFSYNGYGYSPTALVWLAKREGYRLIGIVDFDVLDAVDEFLGACDRAEVRGTAGMETRAYLPQFSTREINSPGEPGITYHMGVGFVSSRVPEGEAHARQILADMRRRATDRNRDMVARINAYLDPVTVDYDRDVLPLTPAGNATERHMCVAYVQAADEIVHDPVDFWAVKLNLPRERIAAVIDRGPQIQNLVRAGTMKRGGVGYVQPGPDTFPTVEEVNAVVTACGALPTITWLDGTSTGEQAAEELFGLLMDQGALALNIVPDRNWNIGDPQTKQHKLQKLYDVVALAQSLDLPINVGTEMNAHGLPLIDRFDVPELSPVRDAFIDGAYTIYGHTLLQRALGLGYTSAWATRFFPARGDRNRFYAQAGRRLPPGPTSLAALRELGSEPGPDDVLSTTGR